jgi:hypothetical protein
LRIWFATRFSDRVFCCAPGESERPLSSYWNGTEPALIRLLIRGVKLFNMGAVRSALRYTVTGDQELAL